MRTPFRSSIGAAIFTALTAHASAGGTTGFEPVDRLLKAQPRTYALLDQTLVLPDSVFAEFRLGPHFEHLSAVRHGPYSFRARVKGSTPDDAVRVIVCTEVRYLARDGRALRGDRIFGATRIEERLVSVQLRDPTDEGPLGCPDNE